MLLGLKQPWLWCAYLITIWRWGQVEQVHVRQSERMWFYEIAASAVILQIGIEALDGIFMDGFMPSPYDRSVMGMMGNLFTVFPPLIAREYIRGRLLTGAWHWTHKWLKLTGILLFFVGCQLNYSKLATLRDIETIVVYGFEHILPLVIEQIFLIYLVMYGGTKAAILYVTAMSAFEWYFPLLPNPNWLARMVIRLGVLGGMCVWIEDHVQNEYGRLKRGKQGNDITTAITLAGCVAFIWFFAGVFPVYPSVVLTGSMEPDIAPGDVVLIDKISDENQLYELAVGDVINFDRDEINISHRIVDVLEDEQGNRSFQTKGDNNSSEDVQLVALGDVRGRIIYDVPKLGMPVLWFRGNNSKVRDEVEF